jgi:hypothetical protein
VANIAYSTQTLSGMTNADGEFDYLAGETITFSIGGIELPSTLAKELLSPLDLVGTTDTNNTAVVNIARLLQSLDVDGDPDNGIEISDVAAEQAQGLQLDFSSPDFDAEVVNLVANSGSVTTTLIDADVARLHLEESLGIAASDRDGDGVADAEDTFPDDANESADSDSDGVGDNADVFPNDAAESVDRDGDGVGDNADVFPDDPDENSDSDSDGVGDVGDFAPNDPDVQTICESSVSDLEKQAAGCDNPSPVADAGADTIVESNMTVGLDGSGSFDPDGTTLTYSWRILSGPGGNDASLDDPQVAQPSFFSGSDNVASTFVVELTVSDGISQDADTVTISVIKNPSPLADAGLDIAVVPGMSVELDGSNSADPEGDTLTYLWNIVSGPDGNNASLDDTLVAQPNFDSGSVTGNFEVALTVSDGISEDSDTVSITVANPCLLLNGSVSYSYNGVITSCTGICSIFTAVGENLELTFDSSDVGPGNIATGAISNVSISLSTPSGGALGFVDGFSLGSTLAIDTQNNIIDGTGSFQATGATTGIVAQAVIDVLTGNWTAFVVPATGPLEEIAAGTGAVSCPALP